MGFELTAKEYMAYMEQAAACIYNNKDYITDLDAATGDGDHWVNLNKGFQEIVQSKDMLSQLSISDMFKQMGMKIMNAVGGSSGVLYGSAFLSAAKICKDKDKINRELLCDVLDAMVTAMMNRGNSQPGQKTMIDAIYPAVQSYKKALESGASDESLLLAVKEAAKQGAMDTKDMEAIRGRACYQANKGVGHIDPGAVSMAYQIETMMDFIHTLL